MRDLVVRPENGMWWVVEHDRENMMTKRLKDFKTRAAAITWMREQEEKSKKEEVAKPKFGGK